MSFATSSHASCQYCCSQWWCAWWWLCSKLQILTHVSDYIQQLNSEIVNWKFFACYRHVAANNIDEEITMKILKATDLMAIIINSCKTYVFATPSQEVAFLSSVWFLQLWSILMSYDFFLRSTATIQGTP